MSDLLQHVGDCIQGHRLFRSGERILVAVSGGLDSMVLLDLLYRLAPKNRWRLTVAHLNHQLRGRSSQADERLVRRTAEKLELPIVVETADVRGLARDLGISVEMAARQLRHEFLARVAAQRRIPSIALAHHADDQLELFFLRLLRGSGGEGLAGMKWCSPSPHNGKIELVRPLLDSSKDALRDYARAHGIRYREDASNACRDFQRNRVRHELIPLLKKSYQPALDKVISRAMEVTGAEAAVVSKLALGWLERDSDHGGGSPALLWSERFEKLPVAIQRRCIQFQLIRHGIALEFDLVEALRLRLGCAMNVGQRSTSTKGQVGRVTPCAPLGGGETASGAHGVTRPTLRPETGKMPDLRVRLDATGLVHLESLESAEFLSGLAGFSLKGKAGDSSFDGISIEWRLISSHGGLPKKHTPGQEVFDADRIGPRVILRHWRPGDRFQPIGMDSAIKLQDFFTNEKISRQRRRELVLAVTGNDEVFWVEGLRISERFKLTKATKRSLQWAWRRVNCDACGHA